MLANKNECPHCKRKWYRKTGDQTNGDGNQYYSCECLICHKPFDMEPYWYNHYNKKMRYLGNEDRDVAELLINDRICIFCEGQIVKSASQKITKTEKECIVEAEIFHCQTPHCEIRYYIPKSMYDDMKKVS